MKDVQVMKSWLKATTGNRQPTDPESTKARRWILQTEGLCLRLPRQIKLMLRTAPESEE
jgi:hypothetical protein